MADVVSRIKLEAEGGDRAAQEIKKVKSAYEEASEASDQMSGSVQGGDPFKQATSRTQSDVSRQVSSADQRQESLHKQLQRGQDRESQTRQMGEGGGGLRGIGGMGRRLQRGAGAASSMTQQAASGNFSGAMAGGLGKLGIAGAIAGIGLNTTNQLAQNEMERVESIYGSGLSQQMNMGYDRAEGIRQYMMELGLGTGMGKSTQFLQSMTQSGGQLENRADFDRMSRTMEVMMGTGASTSTMGQFAGLTNLLNISAAGDDRFSQIFGQGVGQFGRQNTDRFTQAINQMVESMLSAGSRMEDITSGVFERASRDISAYGEFGGMDIRGATQLHQQVSQQAQQASQLGGPMDILTTMRMKKEDESLTDAMIRMSNNPSQVTQEQWDIISEIGGGDKDKTRITAMHTLGLNVRQADSFVRARRAIENDEDIPGLSKEELLKHAQDPARRMQAAENIRVFRPAEDFFADLRAGINEKLGGEIQDFVAPSDRDIDDYFRGLDTRGRSGGGGGGTAPESEPVNAQQMEFDALVRSMGISADDLNPGSSDMSPRDIGTKIVGRLRDQGRPRGVSASEYGSETRQFIDTVQSDPTMEELRNAVERIASMINDEITNKSTTDEDE